MKTSYFFLLTVGISLLKLATLEALAEHRPNAIQIENNKPGTIDWQLTNGADDRQIEGFASLTDVERGNTIKLFVNSLDPLLSIEVFRLGWYGGLGGRRVMGPVPYPGTQQPAPLIDTSTGLIEYHWSNPYELRIPDEANRVEDYRYWPSGVHVAKLTGLPSTRQSYIIFVVRDDKSRADFLFQTSVTTYQAYNNWGGKSLYAYNSDNGIAAVKVSFNRPYGFELGYPSYRFIGMGMFAAWEYNMVRFLEREGYDISYCTDVDTHQRGHTLLRHRAYLSVGHDEYWSWQMRHHVEAARDHGVNLGFFSANTCVWQIRFEPSIVTGARDKTMVCYKSAAADPFGSDSDLSNDHLVTTYWKDPPVGRPQNAMIGVMYNIIAVDTNLVIRDASHWTCAGTGVTNGQALTALVGYEADGVWNNSQTPAGLQNIADSPVPPNTISDQNDPAGARSSAMTVYTAASGAMVFATGTIQWSWGLDHDPYLAAGIHDSRLSPQAQQMTRNVLNRFKHREEGKNAAEGDDREDD